MKPSSRSPTTFAAKGGLFAALLTASFACSTAEPEEDKVDNATAAVSVSLPGSDFEIDSDANLIVDGTGTLDWANVDDIKKGDMASGHGDDSYHGGSKEDDPCPKTEYGSIPNNKSDLKMFGVYEEKGSPGYLHLFWTRVQDPSGTTLLDFELNQNGADCGNGVNPVRTAGDLLLEYRIVQGGATATIKIREWSGTEWGEALDLSAIGAATGTINDTTIAPGDSDGMGGFDPRTFGEASIDLDFIFEDDQCLSFGSAFVKSRASDAFTSQLKDFIAPAPINITNCGKVIIRKETDPAGGGPFDFSHTMVMDPANTAPFSLSDGESKTFTGVLLGDTYTVTENSLPSGYELIGIDCGDSVGVTPTVDTGTATVSFYLDHVDDIVDCTFTNRARGKIIVEKVTSDGSGSFNFTSSTLSAFSLTTTGPGSAGKATRTFADLVPGTYDVSETVPAYWNLTSATCDDGSPPSAIDVSAGETVTCTFVNARERGAIRIHKTRKHAAASGGTAPHPGVVFQIAGGGLAAPIDVTTDSNGDACVSGLLLSAFGGDYSVTEVVPAGYVADAETTKAVTVVTEESCPNGALVNFGNTPLTNLSVAVDSQVDGGTASTISCTGAAPVTTNANGDGSVTLYNLVPNTYTCVITIDP